VSGFERSGPAALWVGPLPFCFGLALRGVTLRSGGERCALIRRPFGLPSPLECPWLHGFGLTIPCPGAHQSATYRPWLSTENPFPSGLGFSIEPRVERLQTGLRSATHSAGLDSPSDLAGAAPSKRGTGFFGRASDRSVEVFVVHAVVHASVSSVTWDWSSSICCGGRCGPAALLRIALLAAAGLATTAGARAGVTDDCFVQQGRRFGLDPALLRSIGRVESGLRPHALNQSHLARTGTRDIGLMQINSGWLPTLARYGISEADLYDACTNIEVASWILSSLTERHGNTWAAVGAYNAACTQLNGDACLRQRAGYAWKVHHHLQQAQPTGADHTAPAAPTTGLVQITLNERTSSAAPAAGPNADAAESSDAIPDAKASETGDDPQTDEDGAP
jgi:Transglycosylase SLT domain